MSVMLAEGRMQMRHETDPKKHLLDKVGDLSEMQVMFNNVLVAVYQRGETANITKGGLYIPQKTQNEDRWQGKVGLVIAKGPKAYKDDETTKFDGETVEVGDWVFYWPSDGKQLEIKGVLCRLFTSETQIRGKIPNPDYVF